MSSWLIITVLAGLAGLGVWWWTSQQSNPQPHVPQQPPQVPPVLPYNTPLGDPPPPPSEPPPR
jgi:hypothetical protein